LIKPDPVSLSRQACELPHVKPGTCPDRILREQVESDQELPPYVDRHLAQVLFHPLVDEDLIPAGQRPQLRDGRLILTLALTSLETRSNVLSLR